MDEKQGNVKVVCRFRPLNEREKAISHSKVNQLLDAKTVIIKENKTDKGNNQQNPKFTFDRVFDCDTSQQEVYNYAASEVVSSVIQGFNGTIFAYGQTSSGKTHTMEGQISQEITKNSGIIPRMVKQVFDSINNTSENVEFRIKVSIVQLYMEKLKDILDNSRVDLKIRSDKKKGIYIQGMSECYISSPEEVYELMEKANNNRAIAATNMNDRSSRSHMLFIMTISQHSCDDMSAKTGKLYLVDLAGSQKVGKTGAQGKTLDQAKKINVSLTCLGKVIFALTDGRATHIPYRDSKLTRVLQESLGGNSKTSLIVTCSPHVNNLAETLSTLRFGVSAKKIKNKPKINKEMTVAELQSLLQKTQRDLEEKIVYIDNLKKYIHVDLKVKHIPEFLVENTISRVEEESDIRDQLEKQLEIQRNFNTIQAEDLNNYKKRYDTLSAQKDQLQQQLLAMKQKQKERNRLLPPTGNILNKSMSSGEVKTQIQSQDPSTIDGSAVIVQDFLEELNSISSDPNVLKLFKDRLPGLASTISPTSNCQLLEQLAEERDKRIQAEQKFEKYEMAMQKKLNQLENNICQLTHAYYDLLVIQQRYKVDNIFLKQKIEDKDRFADTLKRRIKEVEDMNRELEERGSDDRDRSDLYVTKKQNEMGLKDFEQMDDYISKLKKENNSPMVEHKAPKVIKVVKGGHR